MNSKKHKLILDANIYISAVLFGGKSGKVCLYGLRKAYDLYVSQLILEEIKKCLSQKFDWDKKVVNAYIQQIKRIAHYYNVQNIVSGICRDPKDDHILSLAVETGADYIVSGDKDLLSLKSFHAIKILDAAK